MTTPRCCLEDGSALALRWIPRAAPARQSFGIAARFAVPSRCRVGIGDAAAQCGGEAGSDLEKRFGGTPQILLRTRCPLRRLRLWIEVIAEIRSVLFDDSFRKWLGAVVVATRRVKTAVPADMRCLGAAWAVHFSGIMRRGKRRSAAPAISGRVGMHRVLDTRPVCSGLR